MSGSWPVWVALVCLVFSHVFMFALGATLYHCLRWISMKPIMQRPQSPVDERKLMAIAERAAKASAQNEQFAWMARNQQVNGGTVEDVEEEQKFAGTAKK